MGGIARSERSGILEVKGRYEKAALLIEDASISTGLIQSLREKQVNVVAIPVNRDKQSRVISQIDQPPLACPDPRLGNRD